MQVVEHASNMRGHLHAQLAFGDGSTCASSKDGMRSGTPSRDVRHRSASTRRSSVCKLATICQLAHHGHPQRCRPERCLAPRRLLAGAASHGEELPPSATTNCTEHAAPKPTLQLAVLPVHGDNRGDRRAVVLACLTWALPLRRSGQVTAAKNLATLRGFASWRRLATSSFSQLCARHCEMSRHARSFGALLAMLHAQLCTAPKLS